MQKKVQVVCNLKGISIGGIDYPVPDKICNDSQVIALDANKDHFIDADDNTCNAVCRSKIFLKALNPKFEKHAEYFLDFSSMVYLVNDAFNSVFCLDAIQSKALTGTLDMTQPLPCCIPYNMAGIISAEIALREFAKKYGWGREFRVLAQHSIQGSNIWTPMYVYRRPMITDAENMAGVEFMVVQASSFEEHDLGNFTSRVAGDVFGKWNMLAAFISDFSNEMYCVRMSAALFPTANPSPVDNAEQKKPEKPEQALFGLALPLIVIE